MSEKRIAVVGPEPGNGGVGTYSHQLANRMPDASHITIANTGENSLIDIIQLVRKLRSYDVINIHYTYQLYGHRGSLTWALYPLLPDVPVYTTMHEVWDFETIESPPVSVKRLYLATLHNLLALSSDKMIFLAKNAKRAFKRTTSLGSDEVIPHGVDLDSLQQFNAGKAKQMFGFNEDECIISQIGYVSRRKGIETFLESASKNPEYEFMFAGGPRNEDSAEYYTELQTRAPSNVTFTGTLSKERFHAAFDASNLVLLPYESIRQSGILNWCAAHETPVLASDLEYFKDLNREFDYPLVCRKDDIPNSIQRALEEPRFGKQLKQRYSFDSTVKKYSRVFSLEQSKNE